MGSVISRPEKNFGECLLPCMFNRSLSSPPFFFIVDLITAKGVPMSGNLREVIQKVRGLWGYLFVIYM